MCIQNWIERIEKKSNRIVFGSYRFPALTIICHINRLDTYLFIFFNIPIYYFFLLTTGPYSTIWQAGFSRTFDTCGLDSVDEDKQKCWPSHLSATHVSPPSPPFVSALQTAGPIHIDWITHTNAICAHTLLTPGHKELISIKCGTYRSYSHNCCKMTSKLSLSL